MNEGTNPDSGHPFPMLPVVVVAAAAGGLAAIAMVAMIVTIAGHSGMMGRGGSGPLPDPTVVNDTQISIDIHDFAYGPASISVPAGASITWANRDSAPHTATDDVGDTWDTGVLKKGESGTVVFDTPGSFAYYCTLHPYMKGLVIVR